MNGESWQWQSSDSETGPWNDIADAGSASHTPQTGDIDRYLRAVVTYRDGHGSGQDTAGAATTHPVRPEPNRPPAFGEHTATFNISINVREGVRVAPPFTAEDPNGDTLVYSIVPGTPDAFTINPSTGEVLMGNLELTEGDAYTASISVTDGRDDAGQEDHSPDDTLDLTMTIVNPNIVIQPSSRATFPNGLWVDDDIVVTTNSGSRDWALYYDREHPAAPRGPQLPDTHGQVLPHEGGLERRRHPLRSDRRTEPEQTQGQGLRLPALRREQAEVDGHQTARQQRPSRRADRPGRHPLRRRQPGSTRSTPTTWRLGNRRSGHDINGIDTLRKEMTDIWTDGDTVWVSYWLSGFIRAYDMDTGERRDGLDVQLARENAGPSGIDSDGFNLWALDQVNDTIYGYVVPR